MDEHILQKGEGPIIQHLHANGYPPEVYQQMSLPMEGYTVVAPYQRPLWPDADPMHMNHWHLLAQDLIAHMDRLKRTKVIGMGHSMGGIVSLIAADKRPDLFDQLILIDPVILPRQYTLSLRLLPYAIKKRFLPIVKIALRRRDSWSSYAEAEQYFGMKRFYIRFDDRVKTDFLRYGLKVDAEGAYSLTYHKSWEARIYATAPYVWDIISRVKVPVHVIRGLHSDVLTDTIWHRLQGIVGTDRIHEITGAGHLVPFELPSHCGALCRSLIT